VLQRGPTSTSRALGSRVQSCRTPLVAHGTCAEHGKSLSTFSMHSCRLWPAIIFMSGTVTQHSAVGATRSVSRLRGTPGYPSIAGKRRQGPTRARLQISLPDFHASSFGRHVTALLRMALETHVRICAGGTSDLTVYAHLQCGTVDGRSVTLTCDPFRSEMSFPYSRRASR
jgi:hypothetical protein